MTEIEKKANALMNEVCKEHGFEGLFDTQTREHGDIVYEGLCRAIEKHEADKAAHAATVEGILKAHEAYKQEVSDVVEAEIKNYEGLSFPRLARFLIPKPDPLVEAWIEATGNTVGMGPLNEALAKRGLKIVETGQ